MSLPVWLCSLEHSTLYAQEPARRSVALLDLTERNGESGSKLFSAHHALDVAGMPFVVTSSIAAAVQHPVVVLTSKTEPTTFEATEKAALAAYVQAGGVLIAPNVKDPDLYATFGIAGHLSARTRHTMTWDMTRGDPALSYFDHPLEQTISFGRIAVDTVIMTRSYTLDGATAMAYFDDGSVAVTRHDVGNGCAYALGFSFSDLIMRNQTGADFNAQRTFSNGFEPTSDVVMLFLRGIYTSHVPFGSWKHTSPFATQATLIITHDVDGQSGMDLMHAFADLEQQRSITATYFITTHYIHDVVGPDFYTPNLTQISELLTKNQKIASHSVGHFPDWHQEDLFPVGEPGLTKETYQPFYDGQATTRATVFGEIEVSKNLLEADVGAVVKSFRSGHLLWNKKQGTVLDSVGYQYDSSNSANDVLTNFPYVLRRDNSFSGEATNIYEIPVTLSDVFRDNPMTADNYLSAVAVWHDVILNNAANYAPTLLLIHPNRDYKVLAQEALLDNLSEDMLIMDIDAFGDYWRARVAFGYTSSLSNDVLTITLPGASINDMVSIVINQGDRLAEIVIQKENGEPVSFQSSPLGDGDLIVSRLDVEVSSSLTRPENTPLRHPLLGPNAPNPFKTTTTIAYHLPRASRVRLSVFNLLGQEILVLEDSPQSAGDHTVNVDLRAFPSGLYFYRLQADELSQTRSMVLAK